MNFINHSDNGAHGLRVAASVLTILGWLSLIIGVLFGIINASDINILFPVLCGVLGLGAMYLLACCVRAMATVAEAAQCYLKKNMPEEYEDEDD